MSYRHIYLVHIVTHALAVSKRKNMTTKPQVRSWLQLKMPTYDFLIQPTIAFIYFCLAYQFKEIKVGTVLSLFASHIKITMDTSQHKSVTTIVNYTVLF